MLFFLARECHRELACNADDRMNHDTSYEPLSIWVMFLILPGPRRLLAFISQTGMSSSRKVYYYRSKESPYLHLGHSLTAFAISAPIDLHAEFGSIVHLPSGSNFSYT